jgi:hypothetical protein
VYSRASIPAADESPPTVNDHWHAAYGVYLCDSWYQFAGHLETPGTAGYQAFARTGIHSHDDGVMHWHPSTSAAVGENAVLGVFLENYGVELTNDSLTFADPTVVTANPNFPPANVADILPEYVEGETQCDGEDAELAVKAWSSYTDTDSGKRYIANMDRVHVDNDGMVFAIYFAPKDADQQMPPWASQLPELGAIDTNQVEPGDLIETDTTVPGDTSTAGDTATGDTATTVPATSAPATTVPDESAPSTTAAG